MATPPVFPLEEFHRERSPAGYSPWDHKELDATDRITLSCLPYKAGVINHSVETHTVRL